MSPGQLPRVVVLTRPTEYEQLLAEHGTRGQAQFFLHTRGRDIAEPEERHHRLTRARDAVTAAIPRQWRRGSVTRADLDRFLFEPDDVIVVVGQDGLVANVAKYLTGQPVIGVNPDPASYEGVLVRCAPGQAADLIQVAAAGRAAVEERAMAEARLDDGATLLALNEIFVGHRSHQSARYRLIANGTQLRQISSGLIVTTGTGATGWARSISQERRSPLPLPKAAEHRLAFFVREPFPASGSQISVSEGTIAEGHWLTAWSEMETGGAIFADGIETDTLTFDWGRRVDIHLAPAHLRLVIPA
jgi:NAD kinase